MRQLETRCAWDWGLIRATSEDDIPAAVRRHQATAEHAAGRRRVSLVESNRLRRERVRQELSNIRLVRTLERERSGISPLALSPAVVTIDA